MYLDLYPIASRAKIEKLFEKIDGLPLTKLKRCKIFRENDPYNRYPVISIYGIIYRVSRLVLERRLNKRLSPKKHALHNCDHPRCVNEDHIYEGDSVFNSDDRLVKEGNFSTSNVIVPGRVRLNEDNSAVVDLFGNRKPILCEKIVKPVRMRFFDNQFIEIIDGPMKGHTGNTLQDIPLNYKLNSKTQIKLSKTQCIYYIKICHIK